MTVVLVTLGRLRGGMRGVLIRKVHAIVLFLGSYLRKTWLHERVRRVIGVSPVCLHFYFNI